MPSRAEPTMPHSLLAVEAQDDEEKARKLVRPLAGIKVYIPNIIQQQKTQLTKEEFNFGIPISSSDFFSCTHN